jgi:hypothetical protein
VWPNTGGVAIILISRVFGERGIVMWAAVTCPKCGENVEVDLTLDLTEVYCPACLENFVPAAKERASFTEGQGGEWIYEGFMADARADSSFWLG